MIGRIVKSLSGFYEVKTEAGTVTCRARGHVRRDGCMPLTGDLVEISCSGSRGMVEKLLPRKNSFLRPAVANVDALVVFAANVNPVTEPFLIDRVAAIAGCRKVPVILCLNKTDLDPAAELGRIYEQAGFPVIRTSAKTGAGMDRLRDAISGKLTAFTGNSGVGKSSVLNCLAPALCLQTGAVSEKLGRGRHTTRHVELYALDGETFVADTPGFSSFDTDQMELISKEDLQYAFPDFAPYLGRCRFRDCAHLKEPDCAVTQALREGKLQPTRYDSYVRLYEKAREVKARQWN